MPTQPTHQATPDNSRYVPFSQQDYCCAPTCMLMVMYRHGIPLMPAEELGYHLGLTVPPADSGLFYNARISETPPSQAGYGTQIYNPLYEPNKVFGQLGLPLKFNQTLASHITDADALMRELADVEKRDTDALLCFNHGVIRGEYKPRTGHVVVFDRIVDGKVRIIDPSWKHPKWRLIEPSLLFEAIQRHGNELSGGIWHLTYTGQK